MYKLQGNSLVLPGLELYVSGIRVYVILIFIIQWCFLLNPASSGNKVFQKLRLFCSLIYSNLKVNILNFIIHFPLRVNKWFFLFFGDGVGICLPVLRWEDSCVGIEAPFSHSHSFLVALFSFMCVHLLFKKVYLSVAIRVPTTSKTYLSLFNLKLTELGWLGKYKQVDFNFI